LHSVETVLQANAVRPADLGGKAGTAEFTDALVKALGAS
jgi:isocitrate/isopropylmalate dehydrogenase